MAKKAKHAIQSTSSDHDLAREADFYARRCGLTRDETLRIIRRASAPKGIASSKVHLKSR
ncbi:MAG: hypothetical protein E5Y89_02700 [Mesorhizobium sp.]|nr:MAG: hypothetical protein EOS22_06295 [Mesorhizobium sp.]TIL82995.1 MAG: hypothetical protein E5Y89_02700 [Mesorhizobium sp.]TJW62225.1 MAG: hypothetical protein E5V29_26530 [Mesorhizobium sp.]